MVRLLIAWLLFSVYVCLCGALDVSFIPNDENAPLPQSTKYRAALRRLCELVEDKSRQLPKELAEKRKVVEKMCLKLKKDDQNVAGSLTPQWLLPKHWLFLAAGVGGGWALWSNRHFITSMFRLPRRKVVAADAEEFRAARLRRLAGGHMDQQDLTAHWDNIEVLKPISSSPINSLKID